VASVVVDHVSKRFALRHNRADSVGQFLVRMIPSRRPTVLSEPFWALRDVSFTMKEGRSLGIIGHNGAGKSTLLKILTKTMRPTAGTVHVNGRTSALIELGAGFHPDFTGRENIVLNASILGVSRREIERRMSDIIEFSGIAPFIDTPVKYYSSGMHARLGFSVAIHVDPEILIVDEVLAVGDQAFSEQCMTRIYQMKRDGVGILLVTHSLDSVETLMDEAVWLDHGIVMAQGAPRDVVHAYREHVAHGAKPETIASTPDSPHGEARDQNFDLLGCTVAADDGRDTVASGQGMRVTLRLDNASGRTQAIHIRLLLQRPDGLTLCEFSTRRWAEAVTLEPGAHAVTLRVGEVSLVPGTYDIAAFVTDRVGGTLVEDRVVAHVTVWANTTPMGLCVLDHSWGVE
jgi:ABC-type polysaccharide/polyol phosphate transport system ATPase subunit